MWARLCSRNARVWGMSLTSTPCSSFFVACLGECWISVYVGIGDTKSMFGALQV
ncbi:hypothetical protein K469DRAFT_140351 [Zopfia rhizophila CBS 207.26]|uniref:Uncharacterized protein n=1 Tax=Zopfia rhizophila CBS 207.26 TaxID=1314779 RepID=A0A6A6E9P1_9PEZI|nr:hypothetical protein K469DRAFT_140351 [Zopfia rhizophila CBS 207.26]